MRGRVTARADGCARAQMGQGAQTGDGVHKRVRAGADGCVRAQTSARFLTRLHPRAPVCTHTSTKKMDPSGTHGLMHRDCSSSGWII